MAVVNVKVAAKRQYWKSKKKKIMACNDVQSHEKGHYLAAMADVGQILANKLYCCRSQILIASLAA